MRCLINVASPKAACLIRAQEFLADRRTHIGKCGMPGIEGFQRIGDYLSEPIRLFSGNSEACGTLTSFFCQRYEPLTSDAFSRRRRRCD